MKHDRVINLESELIALVIVVHFAVMNKHKPIPILRYLELKLYLFIRIIDGDIKHIHRAHRLYCSLLASPLSSNHLYLHVFVLHNWDFFALHLVVHRLDHFILAMQVDPHMKSSSWFFERSRHLAMYHSFPHRDPLGVPRFEMGFLSIKIFS